MNRRRMFAAIGAACVLFLLVAGAAVWGGRSSASQLMTAAEAAEAALAEYPGDIIASRLEGGVYRMELEMEAGLYELGIEGSSGEVVSIKRLQGETAGGETPDGSAGAEGTVPSAAADEGPATSGPETGGEGASGVEAGDKGAAGTGNGGNGSGSVQPTAPASTPAPSASEAPPEQWISERRAIELALAQVPGEVEDVELESDKRGGRYYLVEIDTPDDREATVQIGAITGEIMSVTWDDDDDE